ncbi:hypothetical protein GCM10011584_22350 [Nocardioides phosphati]|uniref:Uncharacterized protein n=1 Tax=Nocardioides phosphati TaxID=1867775 RepID=A0ABQ2NC58_9ACTN|nr:hypothetical protein [Nocardioides phosphati]GGO90481.1 hypothetical protein GCM10011584_22350 [Nocardioides phosphati]
MAEATATADGGLVRLQRRAWTTSRGCWRLVVLLGLAWVALLLIGGTAHAAPADEGRSDTPPTAPGPIPLLGQSLASLGTVAEALPIQPVTQVLTSGARSTAAPEPVAQPVAHAVETVTQAAASATTPVAKAATSAAAAAPAYAPAVGGLQAVSGLTDSVRATAEDTASSGKLLDVKVPSFGATLTPVVAAAGEQVDAATQLAADAAVTLAAPLPVAYPLHQLLAPVAHAVDLTTDTLTSTATLAGRTADAAVARTTRALAPVLAAVTGPAGSIAVSGPGAGGSSGVPALQPGLPAAVPGSAAPAVTDVPAGAIRGTASVCSDDAHGGPAVPPPDASASSSHVVAQPASDIATVAPVPVSGAGSTTGGGGSAPTPAVDQTLVRVESEPEFTATTTEPIEGPTGPMPGTPADDPAFSPD